jgi:DMSO reductase anchor subunit
MVKKGNDVPSKEDESDQELLPPESDQSMLDMVKSIQEIVKPFAKAQETQAVENTKQLTIRARLATLTQWHTFTLAASVVILAGIAIATQQSSLAEKIVIALLSFMGGYGYAKSRNG